MKKRTIQTWVTISAAMLAFCGLAMVFFPVELSTTLTGEASSTFVVSLWGGAMLGFAGLNWVARHSVLGGIYGRPIVVGNWAHFFVGFMVLLRVLIDTGFSLQLGIMLGFYALLAIFFSYLMFWASGIE